MTLHRGDPRNFDDYADYLAVWKTLSDAEKREVTSGAFAERVDGQRAQAAHYVKLLQRAGLLADPVPTYGKDLKGISRPEGAA